MPETKKKTVAKTPKAVKSAKAVKPAKIAVESESRSYELVIIVSSKVKAEKRGEIVEKITKMTADFGGKCLKTDEWGLKDLAYPILKQSSGWYAWFNLSLPADAVKKLDDAIKREDKIIRYLVVKQ